MCSLAFFYFCIRFFSDRIPQEEFALVTKYHEKYETYAKNTPILIPFVKDHVSKGFKIEFAKESK